MDTKESDRRICPIEETIKVFGGKWKPSILFHLIEGPCRFNELKRRVPGITQRMLTQQLRVLERDGMVIREHFHEVTPRVVYSLSELSQSLGPLFASIEKWMHDYSDKVQNARIDYDIKNTSID